MFKFGGMTTVKILILKFYFTGENDKDGEWQRVLWYITVVALFKPVFVENCKFL